MKEDKLEKFIKDQREAFEEEGPRREVWERLNRQIPVERKLRVFPWKSALRIAAVFVLGALSWAVIQYSIHRKDEPVSLGNMENSEIKNVAPKPVSNDQGDSDQIAEVVRPPQHKNGVNKGTHDNIDEAAFPAEYREIQAYYIIEINRAQSEVFRLASDRPELKQQVLIEFKQIDSLYTDLKRDLKDNMENAEVIEAMILNYKVKLEILEMMLEQLKESNNETDKPKVYEI